LRTLCWGSDRTKERKKETFLWSLCLIFFDFVLIFWAHSLCLLKKKRRKKYQKKVKKETEKESDTSTKQGGRRRSCGAVAKAPDLDPPAHKVGLFWQAGVTEGLRPLAVSPVEVRVQPEPEASPRKKEWGRTMKNNKTTPIVRQRVVLLNSSPKGKGVERAKDKVVVQPRPRKDGPAGLKAKQKALPGAVIMVAVVDLFGRKTSKDL